MTWYGWLILGFLLACVVALVVVIFKREPLVIRGLTEEERKLLAKIESYRNKKIAEYEAARVLRLESIAKAQTDKLKKLELTYDAAKNFISATKRKEFEMYLNDARSTGDELDKLLEFGSTKPDTES